MKQISISGKAKAYEHRNIWTEQFTGMVKIAPGSVVFHNSTSKISSFSPILTCFSLEPGVIGDGPIYAAIIKNEITVLMYDDDEVRIDLNKFKNDVEIYYAGSRKTERTYDEYGRILQYGGCKKIVTMKKEFKNYQCIFVKEG